MVVYFGRNYIIKELQITIPSNDNLECLQYPTLTLSTSEATNSEGSPVFDVVCTAVPCAESCDSLGEVATCDGLMLLRQPLHGGASSVVIHHGQLRPLWSELLQDLTITVNQDSRMVARIPRTYKFVGQYQCACDSTDAIKTRILSTSTTFQTSDFANEAVFRRNYSVAYLGGRQELKDGTSGVIVLSTSGNGGYFQMAARALTLAFTLQTKVEWVEDGQPKSSEASHPQEDVVRLFPDVEALANYTITASSVVPNDVYPDIRDGETVTYHWGFPGQPSSVVTDVFRIVDADKEPSEFVRAWVVSKTDSLLHILVFCQHSNSTSTFNNEVSVELLSYGCGPDEEPNLSATFGLNGSEAIVIALPEGSEFQALTYGLAVNIILRDYSTSHRYELQANVNKNRTTILDIEPFGMVRLKYELEAAKFEVSVTKYFTTPQADEVRVELSLEIPSPILLDNLDCTRGSLKLTPAWNPIKAQKYPLRRVPTTFDFRAPKHLKNLEFFVELVVGKENKTATISVPNPHHEKISIEFEGATGMLSWTFVSPEIRPAVKDYSVVVSTEDVGCGPKETLPLHDLATLNCTATSGCSTHFWGVDQLLKNKEIPANYVVTISPKYRTFTENQTVLGVPSELAFAHGLKGHSIISVDKESASSRSQIVTLLPFRKTPCGTAKAEDMDATFELTAYAILTRGKVEMPIEGVEYAKLEPSDYGIGGIYKVDNLQPGREYKIRGFLKYPGPLSDAMSPPVTFTTPDEICIPQKYAIKEPGESLNFNCSAAVGTDARFRKEVVWHRVGGAPMPEGVFSRTASFPDARGFLNASLSIPSINDSHAGVYCCSPEPPVEHFYGQPARCAEFLLIVNDLTLDRYSHDVNPGMAVSITCSTNQAGDLCWRRLDGRLVPQTRHTPMSNATRGGQSLTLFLPKVTAEDAGDYQCLLKPTEGDDKASQTFSLRINETLTLKRSPLAVNEVKFGDSITLTCESRGIDEGVQKLWWSRYVPAEEKFEALGTTEDGPYEITEGMDASRKVTLRVRTTPTSQGRYVCAAFPRALLQLTREEMLPMTVVLQKAVQYASVDIDYESVVEMSKPVKLGDSGEALLRCTGYPSSSHERLEWAFKEADKDTVYLIGDQHLGDLTPSNRDRVSELLRCFRPGLNKTFASWPGSEFYNPQTNTTELYSPEEIDMLVLTKFTQDPACESVRGHLVCQYRRLNPLLPSLLQPEFVDFTRRSQHSNGTARAIISLEEIRGKLIT
ncbi:unnamed protein product [Mesocestoides corti]|uniref:Ig-like domain-containing protein n=1 Tax=Mesocestoides corti TaxID=53468 RepID=A0A158QU42_MESCO|nr:unnamed protein product [Mesocestoides corti]